MFVSAATASLGGLAEGMPHALVLQYFNSLKWLLLKGVNKCSAHRAGCLLVGRCVVVSREHLFDSMRA